MVLNLGVGIHESPAVPRPRKPRDSAVECKMSEALCSSGEQGSILIDNHSPWT